MKQNKINYVLAALLGTLMLPVYAAPFTYQMGVQGLAGGASQTAASLEVSPASLVFPTTQVNEESAPVPLTLTNTGGSELTLGKAKVVAGTDFSIGLTTCTSGVLAGGESCIMYLVFNPTTEGTLQDSWTVQSSASDTPVVVTLEGVATPVPVPQVAIVGGASVSFGSVETGQTSTVTKSITNSGTAPLVLGSLSIQGANDSSYILEAGQDSCSTVTLAPGQSCSIGIKFSPTVVNPSLQATVTIPDNTAEGAHVINLTGAGIPKSDPYFSNVALLLHFDNNVTDVKGSTTSSSNGYVASVPGFGFSASHQSASTATTIVNDAKFDLADKSFTIEALVRVESVGPEGGAIVGSWGTGPSTNTNWLLYLTSSKVLRLASGAGGLTTTYTFPDTNYHHVAAVRNANTFTIYVDGVSVGSSTLSGAIPYTPSQAIRTGRWNSEAAYLVGNIDELRITPNVARYTANFTPPTEPHPNN